LGYHTGGYLVFPKLGVRTQMEPGDIVFFRGRMLRHFVTGKGVNVFVSLTLLIQVFGAL
jgi:hypothetical protein